MTNPVENAADIARRVLRGTYDPLLACRDLADLKNELTEVSSDILDTFTAVSSELDGVPLGAERIYWAKDTLALKDATTDRYRAQVGGVIKEALHALLTELGKVGGGSGDQA